MIQIFKLKTSPDVEKEKRKKKIKQPYHHHHAWPLKDLNLYILISFLFHFILS